MRIESKINQVGIDRVIRLEWLERTANLLLAGNDIQTITTEMERELAKLLPSSNPRIRGSISKTMTVLLRTWVKVPDQLCQFRDAGLELLRRHPREIQVAIHWGVLMAVYPFWAAVALDTGRLLRLQGTVGAAQVQRRLREQYGERETVSRRVRYVLRSFVEWGVLTEAGRKGVYKQGLQMYLDETELVLWMMEAYLRSRPSGKAAFREMIESPSLFPFRLRQGISENLLAASPRLEVLRHGLDDNLVMLKRQ
jgi:hypothetical protein